ncbi:HEAT repeat domain-containing protein [Paenibacillus sp. NPDC057934]|uniref:HEAT repeat domain-containing protein n=1 Tax=Paenibacillus sp. NPDC057934 TaxID=3346282 RepID=UPI0036DC6B6E
MAIFDRMSGDILEKLREMSLESQIGNNHEKSVLSKREEEELKAEILRQIEKEEEEEEFNLDVYSSAVLLDGNEGIVEVEYYGSVGYVDIAFTSLDENISEAEYQRMLKAIESIAFDTNELQWREAVKEIESFGERAVMILFSECRKFNLSNEKQSTMIVQLLNRLTNRSLKGRRIIKGILEYANIQQHVKLAILAAGTIRDYEAVQGLLSRMVDPDYFTFAFQALLNLAPKDQLTAVLEGMNKLDMRRADLIEFAFIHAREFVKFGPQAVKTIFTMYTTLENKQLGRVYIRAIQSFKEDAIPYLREVFTDVKDENMLFVVCKTLGSLHMQSSTQILLNALDEHPEQERAIIHGLSFARSPEVAPKLLTWMKETKDIGIRNDCMMALAFTGDRSDQTKNAIRLYFSDRSGPDYLVAMNCLAIMGDNQIMDHYIKKLVHGTEKEQYTIQKHIGKLPSIQQVKLAEAILNYQDQEALLIVMGLQRFNVLETKIGALLERKLKGTTNLTLRIEIYKLIGKHVNKRKELKSQGFLYEAMKNETHPRILSELEQIISNMKRNEGHLSIQRGE